MRCGHDYIPFEWDCAYSMENTSLVIMYSSCRTQFVDMGIIEKMI